MVRRWHRHVPCVGDSDAPLSEEFQNRQHELLLTVQVRYIRRDGPAVVDEKERSPGSRCVQRNTRSGETSHLIIQQRVPHGCRLDCSVELQDIKQGLNEDIGDGRGMLSVGFIPTVAPFVLPRVVKRFSQEFPLAP